jgi:hypothetical protein
MKHTVKHGIADLDRVRTVIERAYDSYKERLSDYSPQLSWTGDRTAAVSFEVMRKKIEARFEIAPEEVRIEGDIPFLFRPFEGKIKSVVGNEVEKWVKKAENGEI